ncbi:nuclear transport factor 2 family protein [Nocardioides alcanivorans]|uniref:nuclear transport factor 2 family protein n=1 Tax=Nocardioides alcanivorans TaxID=2897352 RepID=UPI001F48D194|nr:nuclear transport factor 2 family protein [Nocardioides alcanivorans]
MRSFHHHLGRTGTTQHLLGNHRVSFVDDDTARVYSYARIMHIGIDDQEGKSLELFGEYDDLLVRRSADDPAGTGSGSQSGWLLKRRRLEIHHSIGDWNVIHAYEPYEA